jgi:hypothetical protein
MNTKEEQVLSVSDSAGARREERTPPPHGDPLLAAGRPGAIDEATAPLFANEDASGYRTRWDAIQTGFVDEPRQAVKEADTLVAELMKRLTDMFAEERRQLESQWERSDEVSTEDLRQAIQRYRSFFERLLAI